MSNSDRERENLSNIACISSLSSVPFYISCFLAFYLLTHTSSYDEDKSNIELTIWRCFLVSSRLFIWLLRVGHKCIYMYVCAYVRAAVLVSSFLLRPTIRSFTHTRSDNKNRSFYGGCSNYIYIYVCISLFSLFFSSPHDRLNLWMANETERTDRTGSSSLNRTDTHPSFLFSTYSTSVR